MYRIFLCLLSLTAWLSAISPASAQYSRDASAVKKIDEAINQHYLATDFNKAEGILTGTVKACEDKCSPQTLARAWMYVGIVRGSGKNDVAGAKEAFMIAVALDPEVKLDSALATPETQTAFSEIASAGGGAAAPVEAPSPAPAEPVGTGASAAPVEGGLTCTPEVTEVETRRPIPVNCESEEPLTQVQLAYRPFGADSWKVVRMNKVGDFFQGTIPCDANQISGSLRLYVRGLDASGNDLASWGSKNAPIELATVEKSQEPPPAFPGAEPPARCESKEICPPDFPGCDSGGGKHGNLDWGASCDNSTQCKVGLLCIDGACESAPSCTTDSDCSVGHCEGGKCAVGEGEDTGASKNYKKFWIGVHAGFDIAFVSGTDVCLDANQNSDGWACYWNSAQGDVPYQSSDFGTLPGGGGTIAGGTATGTTRFLLSMEYAFLDNITAGVRLGYAIGGGPPAGRRVAYDRSDPSSATYNQYSTETDAGKKFLPYHVEVRGAYYFGTYPLGKKGFRPYLHLGGGLAQVDARVVVKVADKFDPNCDPSNPANNCTAEVNAWKKLGTGFVTGGGGVQFAITRNFALQANLNAMFMLGTSGFVLEPSLGAVFGAF